MPIYSNIEGVHFVQLCLRLRSLHHQAIKVALIVEIRTPWLKLHLLDQQFLPHPEINRLVHLQVKPLQVGAIITPNAAVLLFNVPSRMTMELRDLSLNT
jgi:hypothetical protein